MLLYDLRDAAGRPVSPYAWRIRECLLWLSIPFETRLLSLGEIRQRFTGAQRTVPVVADGGAEVGDSWAIARHLAARHDPDQKLFRNEDGFRFAAFVTDWVDATIMRPVFRMLVLDIHDGHLPDDQPIFRHRQEKRLGGLLENIQGQREAERPAFQISLHPAREALKDRPYLGGEAPTYADIVLHSTFQWARLVSDFELLRADDRLHGWIGQMDETIGVHG